MSAELTDDFAGLVGHKRHRFAPFGAVRLATIRDGTLRLRDKHGEETAVAMLRGATAQLTKGRIVRLRTPDGEHVLHGLAPGVQGVPSGLRALAAAQPRATTTLGLDEAAVPGPGSIKSAADGSRVILAALLAAGATEP